MYCIVTIMGSKMTKERVEAIKNNLKDEWNKSAPFVSCVQGMLTVVPAIYGASHISTALSYVASGDFAAAVDPSLIALGGITVGKVSIENIMRRHGWHKDCP